MFVLAPGYETEKIPLNQAMKIARDDAIKSHQLEQKKRKESGAPSSDNVDYDALAEALKAASEAATDGDDETVFSLLSDAGEFLAPAVRAPEPFEDVADWAGLSVSCILLSREEWLDGRTEAARGAAVGDMGAIKTLLGKCVKVDGFAVEGDLEPGPELWSHANILGALLQVSDYFQGASFDEKKRFGSQTP